MRCAPSLFFAALIATPGLVASGAAVAAPGIVAGQITFVGKAPTPAKINPTTDTTICVQQGLIDESLIVDAKTGGIRSVVVWAKGSMGGRPKKGPLLDNYRCRYEPHVLVARTGQKMTVRNRDRFLHTTQARLKNKSLFNIALPVRNQTVNKAFKKRGAYSVVCDVHDWMLAWVVVLDQERAAVTSDDGRFTLEGLPPGDHTLELWHETLGTKTATVTVAAGKATPLTIRWKRP